MYFLFPFAYIYIAGHIPPLILFSTINYILISINDSNFTPVIFKQACHADPGADKKWTGSISYISIHLHLQGIMYHFNHINHEIHLSFLFLDLQVFFEHVYSHCK